MTRKPKTSDTQRTLNTQGAQDSLEGAQPDQAEAPQADPQEQAAAPAAEGDPSAASHDAGEASAEIPVPAEELSFPETAATAPVSLAPSEGSSDGATTSPSVAPDLAASADGGRGAQADAPEIHVTCLRPAGRRRAGRRWPGGLTVAHDLTAEQVTALRADPDFVVSVG